MELVQSEKLPVTEQKLQTPKVIQIGWLNKKGGIHKRWSKRYCILLSTSLMLYFADCECTNYRGTADFSAIETISRNDNKFSITTTSRNWEFKTLPHRCDEWIACFKNIFNGKENEKNKKYSYGLVDKTWQFISKLE